MLFSKKVVVMVLPLLSSGLQSSFKKVEPLSRLLLQRSIQTQVCYLHEFHDEPKAKWLAEFGEPAASLEAESLSDRECRPVYAGLDAFCDDVSATDYLRSMAGAETVQYSVRYRVGTPVMTTSRGGAPEGFAETASAAWDMWSSANAGAASRRRNPYLKDSSAKFLEYEETLEPKNMARQLMSTRTHLAFEFAQDVEALVKREYNGDERAHFRDDGDSSPLRFESADLCERLATREAALSVARDHGDHVAPFILDKLQGDENDDDQDDALLHDEEEKDTFLADLSAAVCRLSRKDVLGDHVRRRGLAAQWLNDLANSQNSTVKPKAIAKLIEKQRLDLLEAWATTLKDTVNAEHANVPSY